MLASFRVANQLQLSRYEKLSPNTNGWDYRGPFYTGDRMVQEYCLLLCDRRNNAILIADDVDVAVLVFADGADRNGGIDKQGALPLIL